MFNNGSIHHNILIGLFLCLLASAPAAAEEARRVEDIHVVASPIIEGNQVDRYAGSKTLVTEEQIDALNAQDMTAALRKTPGVNISRYNPVGSFGGGEGGAIFIRGMGSSRPGSEIKTYIDGVPMYMSVWNHPLLDLMTIDVARSIEVYKSPQPQNFGNAVAAVNIVPGYGTGEGIRSTVEVAGGSYGTAVARARNSGSLDRFDYFVSGSYRRSDGHRRHSEGETGDVCAGLGYALNDNWNIRFFGLYSDNSAEDPGREGAAPAEREGTYETSAGLMNLTLANRFAGAEGFIKIYRNTGEGDWLDQPTDTDNVFENLYNDFKFYGVKARESFSPWDGGEIVTGLDWTYTGGDYRKYFTDGTTDHWDGHDFIMTSPYAAVSHVFGDRNGLTVTPSVGARYYDNSDFGEKYAPHAGLLVQYDAFACHAGYARGVVYPGLDVVAFSEEVLPALQGTWKDLKPELMDHYEAGISWTFDSLARAELTWFYNDGKDRYVFVTPPITSRPVYDNVEKYVTRGVEAALSIHPARNLSLFFGATFLDSDPSDLPYAPETTLSTGLNWCFLEHFTLSADLQYVDEMYVNSQARKAGAENTLTVDSYTVVNARLGYQFHFGDRGSSGKIFVAGENLTDTDYEYRPGYPMPGINGMAGVSLTF